MTDTNRLHAAQHAIDAHRDAMREYDEGETKDHVCDLLLSLRQLCESEDIDFQGVLHASIMRKRALQDT